MNILIALPGISFKSAVEKFSNWPEFLDVCPFEPTIRTLDVFPIEMRGVDAKGFWGINIPHLPLEATMTNGLAGPGHPLDELIYPKELEDELLPLIGSYDKWRPYPVETPMTEYDKKLARRFSVKRCKVFDFIVRWINFETLFYVDHSPTSLSFSDQKEAVDIAELIVGKTTKVLRRKPGATCIIFSPYGSRGEPGFILSNKIDATNIGTWDRIRDYLNGKNASKNIT